VQSNPIVVGLLFIAVCIFAVFAVLLFVLAPRATHNEQTLAGLKVDVQRVPLEAAYDTRKASRRGCQRGNPGRQAEVQAYLDIAQGNARRAMAWGLIARAFPATSEAADTQRRANLAEAHHLARDAAKLVNAQRPVARFPRARSVAKRALVDCAGIYPLPAHRGAPLPPPSVP
jgi:hypothetical protein